MKPLCFGYGRETVCFLYAQHNFSSKNTILISEAAVSSIRFLQCGGQTGFPLRFRYAWMTGKYDFSPVFPFKGIFHLDQEKVLMMKVNLCMDSPSWKIFAFRLASRAVFQKVGENQAHIDLVYGNVGWQICLCLEKECSLVLPERHNG